MPEQWTKIPERIMMVTERLKHAQIENMDAAKLISKYNHETVLIYADPPYIPNTRTKNIYAHEMDEQDHIRLLEALLDHRGPVIASGYDNPLYNGMLKNWRKESRTAAAEKGQSKEEVIWMNFDVEQQLNFGMV